MHLYKASTTYQHDLAVSGMSCHYHPERKLNFGNKIRTGASKVKPLSRIN